MFISTEKKKKYEKMTLVIVCAEMSFSKITHYLYFKSTDLFLYDRSPFYWEVFTSKLQQLFGNTFE